MINNNIVSAFSSRARRRAASTWRVSALPRKSLRASFKSWSSNGLLQQVLERIHIDENIELGCLFFHDGEHSVEVKDQLGQYRHRRMLSWHLDQFLVVLWTSKLPCILGIQALQIYLCRRRWTYLGVGSILIDRPWTSARGFLKLLVNSQILVSISCFINRRRRAVFLKASMASCWASSAAPPLAAPAHVIAAATNSWFPPHLIRRCWGRLEVKDRRVSHMT